MPDWPKVSTPSGTTGAPNTPPMNDSACDAPSTTVTIGARRSPAGMSVAEVADVVAPPAAHRVQPPPCWPAASRSAE